MCLCRTRDRVGLLPNRNAQQHTYIHAYIVRQIDIALIKRDAGLFAPSKISNNVAEI